MTKLPKFKTIVEDDGEFSVVKSKCKECKKTFNSMVGPNESPNKICASCDPIDQHVYVAATLNSMKSVGDYVDLKRDKATKWEHESKQEEYRNSSRMAANRLDRQKQPEDKITWDNMTRAMGIKDETVTKVKNKIGDKKAMDRYLASGDI